MVGTLRFAPLPACAGALGKNGLPQLRERIKTRLVVEVAAAWHDLEGRFQPVGYILRTRQWNIGIVITRPAATCAPFALANTNPIE